jgi:hypothetical protein
MSSYKNPLLAPPSTKKTPVDSSHAIRCFTCGRCSLCEWQACEKDACDFDERAGQLIFAAPTKEFFQLSGGAVLDLYGMAGTA